MGTTQIGAVSTAQMGALTTDQIIALGAGVGALSTAAIAALNTLAIGALQTNQIVAFTSNQVAALKTSQVAALTTAQMQALETGDISALSTDAIGALTTDQFVALFTDQVTALTHFQVAALSVDEKNAMSTSQIVSLDLSSSVILDPNDLNFSELKVWKDTNSNALTESGELYTLADLGIVSLDLNAMATSTNENGNTVGLISSYQSNDGRTHGLADVWFTTSQDKTTAATASTNPSVFTVEPTPMQLGVFGLVDAMAAFGQTHANKPFELYEADSGASTLQSQVSESASLNTTSQFVQALRQFDANGNPIAQSSQTVAALAGTHSPKSSETAGVLAINNRA